MTLIPNRVALFVTIALVAALAAPATGQQAATTDLWRLAPANVLMIAGSDARPDSPSMRALDAAQSPEMRATLAKQDRAMRKALEDFALLFGTSLDFAKDIESWAQPQCAVMLLPGCRRGKGRDKCDGHKQCNAVRYQGHLQASH